MLRYAAVFAVGLLVADCATTPLAVPVKPAIKTDLQRGELKGPVKTVMTAFVETDEKGEPYERSLGSSTYNQAGNLVEDEEFTADFVKKRKPELKDANTTVFHSVMGDSTVHYTFDEQGNVAEEQVRYGIKFDCPADTITRYRYDSAGAAIERDFIGPDGKLGGASHYTRGTNGTVAEEDSWINDPNAAHAHMVYRYDFDAHGNWVRRYETRTGIAADDYEFGPSGTLVRIITYYDDPVSTKAVSPTKMTSAR